MRIQWSLVESLWGRAHWERVTLTVMFAAAAVPADPRAPGPVFPEPHLAVWS